VQVKLTRGEREFAATVAVRRCLTLILATPKEDSHQLWGEAVKDATAEFVVARATQSFWVGGDFVPLTLAREIALDVSMHPAGTTHFGVYKPDPNDVHVFVEEGETPLDFVVVGWATGHVVGRREYRGRGGNFNVPREALHDIESMLATIAADPSLAKA
jgi:hypothetical protein